MPLNSLCFQSTLCPLTKEFLIHLQKERTVMRGDLQRPPEVLSPIPRPPGRTTSKTNTVKQKTNNPILRKHPDRNAEGRTEQRKTSPSQGKRRSDELTTRPSPARQEAGEARGMRRVSPRSPLTDTEVVNLIPGKLERP